MAEVCADCGSGVTYRRVDVTSVESESKEYVTVPYVCKNSECPNSVKRNQGLVWFTTT